MSDPSATDESTPTILVVDDERGLADLYEIWLSETYNVRVAYDGESAIQHLDVDVDVVLLDRQMPDLSGDDVLEYIRNGDIECRVAMVTAVDPDFDVIGMGFDDYVQKPVDRDRLVAVVDGLLDRSEYDEAVETFYAAARKRALLEDRKDAVELAESDEYQSLTDDIEDLQDDVAAVTDEFADDDFVVLFRELEETG